MKVHTEIFATEVILIATLIVSVVFGVESENVSVIESDCVERENEIWSRSVTSKTPTKMMSIFYGAAVNATMNGSGSDVIDH